MKIHFSNISKQNKKIKRRFLSKVSSIVNSSNFISGENVEKFEQDFAKYCGVKYCVATSSGTTALHTALHLFDSEGEVLTCPNSYIATSEAVSHCRHLKHKFVDVDETCNMNVDQAIKLTTRNTKIILPTSMYGNPCDLVGLKCLSKSSKSILINDAAQAHGSLFNDKPIASFSDLTCFSFYPGKNLGTCGEGGAVVTNSKKLYDKMKKLINHGQSKKYHHDIVGFNYRMSEIEAVMLNLKLPYLDEWNNKRIFIANKYMEALSENKNVKTLKVERGNKCVYHLFPIFTKDKNKLQKTLNDKGIQTGFHYPKPIHLQRAYKYLNHKKGDFPFSEQQAFSEISLPINAEMTKKEIGYTCKILSTI
tara:strand:+ start:13576 stop:14667 length:1092 start_codon:yes stop_codon:yes gene_type:complete